MGRKKEILQLTRGYSWKLIGRGSSATKEKGDPSYLVSEWSVSIHTLSDIGVRELEAGELSFTVVDHGTATNLGEDLSEVYDSQDENHFDFYNHIKDLEGEDSLTHVSRSILVAEDALLEIERGHRLDVLQILTNIFNDAVVAVWCDDAGEEIGVQLAPVMKVLPSLDTDSPKSVWYYHNGQYYWSLHGNE
jgi:hypothetical protein